MPAVTTDVDETSMRELKESHETVIVAYLTSDHDGVQEWLTAIAEDMQDDFVFCMSDNPKLAALEGVKAPSVVVYKHAAEEKSVIRDLSSQGTIRGSILRAVRPLIMDFVPEVHEDMLNVCVLPKCLPIMVLTVS